MWFLVTGSIVFTVDHIVVNNKDNMYQPQIRYTAGYIEANTILSLRNPYDLDISSEFDEGRSFWWHKFDMKCMSFDKYILLNVVQ